MADKTRANRNRGGERRRGSRPRRARAGEPRVVMPSDRWRPMRRVASEPDRPFQR